MATFYLSRFKVNYVCCGFKVNISRNLSWYWFPGDVIWGLRTQSSCHLLSTPRIRINDAIYTGVYKIRGLRQWSLADTDVPSLSQNTLRYLFTYIYTHTQKQERRYNLALCKLGNDSVFVDDHISLLFLQTY